MFEIMKFLIRMESIFHESIFHFNKYAQSIYARKS